MTNRSNYLDQRNDFNGPDKEKRGYPKRPQRVTIGNDHMKQKDKE